MVGKGPYGDFVMDIRRHAYTDEVCRDFQGQKLTSLLDMHIENILPVQLYVATSGRGLMTLDFRPWVSPDSRDH